MQVGGLIIDFSNCTPDKCSNYDLCDPFYKKKLSEKVELPPTMQSLLQKKQKEIPKDMSFCPVAEVVKAAKELEGGK